VYPAESAVWTPTGMACSLLAIQKGNLVRSNGAAGKNVYRAETQRGGWAGAGIFFAASGLNSSGVSRRRPEGTAAARRTDSRWHATGTLRGRVTCQFRGRAAFTATRCVGTTE